MVPSTSSSSAPSRSRKSSRTAFFSSLILALFSASILLSSSRIALARSSPPRGSARAASISSAIRLVSSTRSVEGAFANSFLHWASVNWPSSTSLVFGSTSHCTPGTMPAKRWYTYLRSV